MDSESDINDRKRKLDSPPRRSGFSDGDRCCEVVVSNIPYEFHWQKLKDLIRDKVGEVGHVKIWQDDNGRHKGAGVAVFPSPEQAKKAVEELNRHDVNGRQLVVKMFTDEEKRKRQRVEDRKDDKQRGGGGGGGGGRSSEMGDRLGGRSGEDTNSRILEMVHTILNSDPSVLKSLGVNENVIEAVNSGQLSDTVFVANVDYAMKWQDLKDIFKMAGNVMNVKMVDGTDGKTKGYGTIQFKSPLDALEAVAKFHGQTVRDRRMTVKIDQMSKNKVSIPELMADYGPRNPPHQEMMPGRSFGGYGHSLGGVGVPPLAGLGSTSLISRELELERLALQREREKILMQSMGSDRPSFPGVGGSLAGEFGRPFPPSRSLEPPMDSFRSSLPPPIPQMERPDPRGGDLRQEEMKLMKQLEMIRSQMGGSGGSMSASLSSMTSTFGGGSSLQSSSSFGRDMLSGGSAGDQANPALAPGFGRAGAAARTGSGGSCQIFIRNLPFQMNWQMLKDRFSEFGKVLYAEIKMENGKSKGCGIVRFSLPQEAENAIMRMNGKVIDGREIEVRFDSSGL